METKERLKRLLEIDELMKSHYILTAFEIYVLPGIRSIHKGIKRYAKTKEYKESGYLVIRSKKDGLILFVIMLGWFPSWKAKKYLYIAFERGERLFHHPSHVSSWQSRDKKDKKQGGAIITRDFIVSFTGISEPLDEAVALKLSVLCKWIHPDKAQEIADISRNHLYDYLK